MPLLDHFHAPLYPVRHWESFHANWAGAIADALNEDLPEGYFAEEHTPPVAALVSPDSFPDTFEVRIYKDQDGAKLVATVELVSPANKDRGHMRNFSVKCATYLAQEISLIVIDIVTSRSGNLHNEMMSLLKHDKQSLFPEEVHLYAVAYRSIVRGDSEQIDVWEERLSVGKSLPTLPLFLNSEVCLPLNLEETYTAACLRRRLG